MISFDKSRLVLFFVFLFSLLVCTRMFADICILTYDTEFKNMLTSALVEELEALEYNVTVDTMAHGKKYKAEDYDAVILLSGATDRQFDFLYLCV